MTLPASGAISMSQVNTELGLSATAAISLNDAAVRSLFAKPSGMISMSDGHGKSARTYATWNPSDKAASITLSGGNLTVAGTTAQSKTRSTLSKSAGKWYWEVTVGTVGQQSIGQSLSTANIDWYTGRDASSLSCGYSNAGAIYQSGLSVGGSPGTYTTGDVLGFALDADANTFAFYKNNVLKYTATLTSGPHFAAAGGGGGGAFGLTANFGATALVYTPPAGFNSGLYV